MSDEILEDSEGKLADTPAADDSTPKKRGRKKKSEAEE